MTDYDINYSLICAIHEGNLKKTRELINSFGLSYSQAWSKGYVLLCDATEKNHTAMIKLLLTNGSKVNSKASKNNPSNTPLHFAVINGNIEIVKMLVHKGADINAKNEYSETPLYIAIKQKKIEIIELFLNCGANVNERDYITIIAAKKRINYDKYTLHTQCFAEKEHEKEIVKMLLNRGANFDDKDQYGRTPLHTATENMKIEITELLLNCGANVNATDNDNITPLHIAAQKRADYELWYYTSTPQHLAVEKEHEKVVKMLLNRGANINAKDKCGRTPLYNAIKNKEMEITELLLNHGANVNIKDNDGITPLHIAAEKGYLQIVERLLKRGAYVNSVYISTSKKSYTPLYLAVEQEHEKLVKLLLECGANVDAQDNDGKTILHFAVEKGQLVIIEHILKYCPDINNKSNRSSLNAAVYHYKKEYSKIVEKLLQYGFTVNSEDVNNCKLLYAAVKKGYLRIVEELLKYGADVNMLYDSTSGNGYTPLHIATKNKQEEVAKLLISYEADVNAKDKTGKTPIFYAIENADLKITKLLLTNKAYVKDNPELLNIAVKKKCREIVEILLQHDADINASDKYGRTALHFTALSEDKEFSRDKNSDNNVKGEIAKLLLKRGANVNAQTKNSITTLHAATYKGYVKVVEALLEHNADVNSVIESDITPLHLSAQKSNEVIRKMFLNKGANVNAKQIARKTALHIATQQGHKEVVEVLLKCGAKIDSKVDGSDITPLHIAAQEGYLEIVEVLLKFDAGIDSRDKYGRTALHIACENKHIQTVIALLEHGSDINIINKNNDTPLDVAMADISLFSNRVVYHYDSNNNFFDSYRGILSSKEIAEILKQHIVKMKTANSYVSKKNLLSISSKYEIRHFQDKCEKEVAIMNSEKISNTNISFYDILTKDKNSLATYMRNENIVQVLKSDDYKTKFPIYASMVENNFRKGMKRKELLEQGNKTFHFLFNNSSELSYYCIEKIFSYLSDEDLRILIVACKPPTVSSPNTDFNDVALTSNISQIYQKYHAFKFRKTSRTNYFTIH